MSSLESKIPSPSPIHSSSVKKPPNPSLNQKIEGGAKVKPYIPAIFIPAKDSPSSTPSSSPSSPTGFLNHTISNQTPTLNALGTAAHVINTIMHKKKFSSKKQEEEKFLKQLKEKGYSYLQTRLDQCKQPLKNKIIELNNIEIAEQLLLLLEAVHHHLHFDKVEIILNHYIDALKSNNEAKKETLEIGKVIYVLDNKEKHSIPFIDLNNFLECCLKTFDTICKDKKKELKKCIKLHQDFKLQDPLLAEAILKPKLIAHFLVLKNGFINTALIPFTLNHFTDSSKKPLNHERSLIKGLLFLKKNPSVRNQIHKINFARNCPEDIHLLLCILLDLQPSSIISDFHIQQSIIISLLSHLRQPSSGSCFAESLAIELLDSCLPLCFIDFMSLLEKGNLSRSLNQQTFSFEPVLSSDVSIQKILINLEGKVKDSDHFLWDFPGFQAVAKTLSISNIRENILSILLEIHPEFTEHPIEISPREIIEHLAEISFQGLNKTRAKDELYRQACFAYDSINCNPLLKFWRNALASMAEGTGKSVIKTNVIDLIKKLLNVSYTNISDTQRKWVVQFTADKEILLKKRVHFKYDPSIIRTNMENLAVSNGAFVLYDNNKSLKTRIDNFEQFRTFLLSIVSEAYKKMKHKPEGTFGICEQLKNYISSPLFEEQLLKNINKMHNTEATSLNEAICTPWICKIGNSASTVLKVYTEDKHSLDTYTISPHSAFNLLEELIDIAKKNTIYNKHIHLLPLKAKGLHSFSLLAGPSSLFDTFQKETMTATAWITKNILQPGLIIPAMEIGTDQKEILIQFCVDHFFEEEHLLIFEKEITNLKAINIKEFRNELLDIVQTINPLNEYSHLQRQLSFDQKLCLTLPPIGMYHLKESLLLVADSNWNSGIHDILLCFIVNPGSGELELWQVYDDLSLLIPLDQKLWIDRRWEFCCLNK